MSDTVPDTNAAFYVRETITDSASEQAPYSSLYGPFSQDAANERAAQLETDFDQREKNRSNPDGPAPVASTRSQDLAVVPAADVEGEADLNRQPEAADHVGDAVVTDAATTPETTTDEPAEPEAATTGGVDGSPVTPSA